MGGRAGSKCTSPSLASWATWARKVGRWGCYCPPGTSLSPATSGTCRLARPKAGFSWGSKSVIWSSAAQQMAGAWICCYPAIKSSGLSGLAFVKKVRWCPGPRSSSTSASPSHRASSTIATACCLSRRKKWASSFRIGSQAVPPSCILTVPGLRGSLSRWSRSGLLGGSASGGSNHADS